VRILAVIDSLRLGGAETQLAQVLTLLAQARGHDCLVCSLLPPQDPEVRFGSQVKRVYLNKKSVLSLPRLILNLTHLIRQYRPDVAYSRLAYANGITRLATGLSRTHVPHVAGIDTVPDSFTSSVTLRHPGSLLYRWLERFADRIACNSESTARAVIAARHPSERIAIVPNGIDLKRFSPPTTRSRGKPIRLVCIASLRPEKGVADLVRALAPVLSSGQAGLTIVGDGPERRRIEPLITELGLDAAVRLAGALVDVVPTLHESDIYVSAAHFEAFGIAVAEAAATGVPAVCFAAPGGLAEVVVDGITGYLIPVGHIGEFCSAVIRLCEDHALREQFGAAAREHVLRHFQIDHIASLLEHCFRNT
jgi:glycosyltransferase involved in cell wall biosynthesis